VLSGFSKIADGLSWLLLAIDSTPCSLAIPSRARISGRCPPLPARSSTTLRSCVATGQGLDATAASQQAAAWPGDGHAGRGQGPGYKQVAVRAASWPVQPHALGRLRSASLEALPSHASPGRG